MEENTNIEEQTEVETKIEPTEASSESLAVEDNVADSTGEAERGVPIGKFKSVDDLYAAYNNLQAEFTRKSQKLAELEKEKAHNQTSDKESCLQAFLFKNQQAIPYVSELDRRLGEQAVSEQAYEKIWADYVYEKLSGKDISKEPLVQDIVLKDDKLQEMIIKRYVEQIHQNRAPVVMQSSAGEKITTPVMEKAKTFSDAKLRALDLLSRE